MQEKTESKKVYERLSQVIPGGVNSPVRACLGLIDPPMVAARGEGPFIYDQDGNRYIDYCGSWGALIHGHAYPPILEAVYKRIALGTSFGVTTEIEEKLARLIVNRIESVEKIRFVSSGTEATMSAVRLARGFTNRPLIVKFNGNYHGHADFFLVKAGSGVMELNASSSVGIPDEIVKHTVSLEYNNCEETLLFLRDFGSSVAAVIIEPIAGNMGVVPASHSFMTMLREETKKCGALLIFDEVITGFRVGYRGAQGLYPITPDLTCFGKIVGGGFPAAAFGGRREIMDCLAPLGAVYQAGTLSGNPVAMESGFQALQHASQETYKQLEEKTEFLVRPIQEYLASRSINACLQRVGSMFTLFFGARAVNNQKEAQALDSALFKKYFTFLYERGIYIPPFQQEASFVSTAHSEEELRYTRETILQFFSV